MSNEGYIFLLHLRQQPLQRHKMQFCTIVSGLALVASGFSCYRYVCVFLSRLWFVCLCVSCRKVCKAPENQMGECTCVHLCVHGQTLAAVWRLLPVLFGASCPLLHSCLVLSAYPLRQCLADQREASTDQPIDNTDHIEKSKS